MDDEHRLHQGIAPDARIWWFPESVVFHDGNHNFTRFFSNVFLALLGWEFEGRIR